MLKVLLIISGYLGLFLLYYIFGWFCDKEFRLVMRKTKLSSAQKIFFHFRGSKMKEDRGHAIICVKFETIAFVNILLGIICGIAVMVTGHTLIFLASGALMAGSFGVFAFQAYINVMKCKERKNQIELMDETGFEDYDELPQSEPPKVIPSQAVRVPKNTDDGDKTNSMAIGKEILKNKGLLDDDVFSPFVADAVDKFKGEELKSSFSEEGNITKGKEALRNYAGKQLSTEGFKNVNNFDRPKNAYGKDKAIEYGIEGTGKTMQDKINEHKQDINPENIFKSVNNYSSVRKDNKQ